MDAVLNFFWDFKALIGDPLFYSCLSFLAGWAGLPQPAWIKKSYGWVKAKFKK